MDYKIKERILKNLLVEITKKYDYILGDYKALELQYNERLLKDYLTGLLNREGFIKELIKIHKRCEKENISYGIILLDLDNFKYINGFYGSDVGDLFIKSISDILVTTFGSNSIVGRIGGDEFAVAVYDIDERELIDMSNSLKKSIEDFKFIVGDSFITTTASIGISFNKMCKEFGQVFEQAAAALAESKQKGKNSITFYDYTLQQKSEKLIDGKNLILNALSKNGSVISYIQPIVETKTKNIVGGEFLMRLNIDGQIYTPFHFLESAVYFGLMDKLENLMFDFISKFNFRKGFIFFINKTIRKEERLTQIQREIGLLERISSFKNIDFVIEITENSLFENISYVKDFIKISREHNINFAIDDFGSGYTSLRYLYDMDINFLKIDGNLIKEMTKESKMISIMEGIVYISKKLGIKTIAEYVETEDDYRKCLDIGFDYVQGYYFYKPMELEEFLKLC